MTNDTKTLDELVLDGHVLRLKGNKTQKINATFVGDEPIFLKVDGRDYDSGFEEVDDFEYKDIFMRELLAHAPKEANAYRVLGDGISVDKPAHYDLHYTPIAYYHFIKAKGRAM